MAECVWIVARPDLLHTGPVRLGGASHCRPGRRHRWELIRDNGWVRRQTEWDDLQNHPKRHFHDSARRWRIRNGLILGTDGNFYGTSLAGGTLGRGWVFKISPRGTLTTCTASTI